MKCYFCKNCGLKKILIIRLSSIGDIVLTTPVIRCLKNQLDRVAIHFVVKEQFLPVVQSNPYIDKIHVFRSDMDELVTGLKTERFDFIADLHLNFRSMIIRYRLGVPAKGFPKLNFRKWMYVKTKINLLPPGHIVDRYFESVRFLGVKNDGKGLDYFIPQQDEIRMDDLPETHRAGYIAFVAGAKHNTKMLPEEKVVSICKTLDQPVILLGGPEDTARGERISVGAGAMVYNACGRYSINQSASIIRQARKVITYDTGLMHIAAAFRKEIISVWGNTVPEFGMFPYLPPGEGKSHIIEMRGLSCRPCSKLGFDKCPKGHFKCMRLIDEKEIINKF
jgi:ADP-heptose:LPS heptosyltransferase